MGQPHAVYHAAAERLPILPEYAIWCGDAAVMRAGRAIAAREGAGGRWRALEGAGGRWLLEVGDGGRYGMV